MSYDHTKEVFDKLAEVAPFWHGALTACVRDGLTTAQTRDVLVKCAQSDPILLEEFNEISARLSNGAGLLKQAIQPPGYPGIQGSTATEDEEGGQPDFPRPLVTADDAPKDWIQQNIADSNAEAAAAAAEQQRQDQADLQQQMIRQQEQLRLQQQEAAKPYRRYEGWLNWDKSQLWRPVHMIQSLGEGAWSATQTVGNTLGALGTTSMRLMEEGGRATGLLSQGQTTFKDLQEDYANRAYAQLKSTGQDVGNVLSGGELRNRIQYDEAERDMQKRHGYRYDKSLIGPENIDWLEQTDRWAQGLGSFAFEMVMPSAALRALNKGRQAIRIMRGGQVVTETAYGGSKSLTLGRRSVDMVDEGLLAAREAGKLGDEGAATYRTIKSITTRANKLGFQGKDATKLLDELGALMKKLGVDPTVQKNLLRHAGDASRQAAGLQTVNNTMKALHASGKISDDALRVWKTLTPVQRAAQAAFPTMAKLAERFPTAQKLLKFIPGAGLGSVSKGSHVLRNLDRMQLLRNVSTRGAALRIPGTSIPAFPQMFRHGGLAETSGHRGLFFGPGKDPTRVMVPRVGEGVRSLVHASGVPGLMEGVGFTSQLARGPLEIMGRIPVLHRVSDVMLSSVPAWYQRALHTVSMGAGPGTRGSLGLVPATTRWAGEAIIGEQVAHQTLINPVIEGGIRRRGQIPNYVTHDPNTGREYSPYERLAQVPYGFRRGWNVESGEVEDRPEMDTGGRRALFNTQPGNILRDDGQGLRDVSLKFALPPDHFRIGLERSRAVGALKTQQVSGSSLLPTKQLNIHDEYMATYLLLHPQNTDLGTDVLPAYRDALNAYRTLSSDIPPGTAGLVTPQGEGVRAVPPGTGSIVDRTTPQLGSQLSDIYGGRNTPLRVPADSVPAAQHLSMQVVMPVHDRIVMEMVGNYYTNAFRHWEIGRSDDTGDPIYQLGENETVWDDRIAKELPELVRGVFDPANPTLITGSGNHINVWHNATWHARFMMAELSAVNRDFSIPDLVQKQLVDSEGQQWWSKAENFYTQMKQWEDTERARLTTRMGAMKNPVTREAYVESKVGRNSEAYKAKFIELTPPIESFRYKGQLYKRPPQAGQPAAANVPSGQPQSGESLPGIQQLLEVSAPTP